MTKKTELEYQKTIARQKDEIRILYRTLDTFNKKINPGFTTLKKV